MFNGLVAAKVLILFLLLLFSRCIYKFITIYMNYELTNLLHLTIWAERKEVSFPFIIINSTNAAYRIAKQRDNYNDNDVLNSQSIVRDKKHDLARNNYIIRSE